MAIFNLEQIKHQLINRSITRYMYFKVPLTSKIFSLNMYISFFSWSPLWKNYVATGTCIFVNFAWIFRSLKNCPFLCSRLRNSIEWDKMASDVISGKTIFRFWEEEFHMQTCTMQGRGVVGGCNNTGCIPCTIKYSSSFNYSILMKRNQKREKDQKSGLICVKLNLGSHRGSLRSQVCHYCKNQEIFIACMFFSISSGKLDIVKILDTKYCNASSRYQGMIHQHESQGNIQWLMVYG